MDITIDNIVNRYNTEVAQLTQRAVIAEARADAAEAKLAETQTEENE